MSTATSSSTTLRALMTRPSVREVLAQQHRQHQPQPPQHQQDQQEPWPAAPPSLTPEAEDAARAALTRLAAAHMPWYLRALIAVGAWTGASFLLSTVLSLILLASGDLKDQMAIAIGVTCLLGSILFRRRVTGPFPAQLALVVSFTGLALLIGGVGEMTHSFTAARIVAILASLALIAWYPDRIQRFFATLIIFGTAASYPIEHQIAGAPDVLAIVLVALILLLWRFAPRDRIEAASQIVEPVVYGLIVALFSVLVTHTIISIFDLSETMWLRLTSVSITTFVIALLALATAIFVEHGIPLHTPIAAVSLSAIVVLGALTRTTPGITASILLLVLAFDRRSRMLMALATVFFLAFLTGFYYDMRLTLLQKSGMLMLTGAVCLAACAALRLRARGV